MKWTALLSLLLLVSCSNEPPPPPANVQAIKFDIQELIRKYHDAADKGDVGTMLSLMDTKVILYRGGDEFVEGLEAAEEVLEQRADDVEAGQSTLLGKHKYMVEGKAAVCNYVANVGSRRGAVTMIFRHLDQKWVITHLHESWPVMSK